VIEHRPHATLGGDNHGWLKAKHHFSFAGYHDPNRMNWGMLRVWNDDEIPAKTGFRIIVRPTWKSSPMCEKELLLIKMPRAIEAGPKLATYM
jgi:hypothetical protein